MTSKPPFNRSDFVRQSKPGQRPGQARRRGQKPAATRQAPSLVSSLLPGKSRPSSDPRRRQELRQTRGPSAAQRYDISFSLGRTSVRAPGLSLPQLDLSNPRWVSGLASLFLLALLFLLWNTNLFQAGQAIVSGNLRLGTAEITNGLGFAQEPIFKAVPGQMEENLRQTYVAISEARVRVGLPNRILVEITERTPLMVWSYEGDLTWIDADGVAFRPIGEVPGLVQVEATGNPADVTLDETLPAYEQRFINPDMVQVILSLAPFVPPGSSMIYDPEYGIGWLQQNSCSIYFGRNTEDVEMKTVVYQALVARLTSQGIQPTLISMEFLDAPFYK